MEVIFIGVLLCIAAEIASFVVVAEHIGFLWTVGILLLVSASGPFVVRRVGVGVLAHTQQRLARGEVPTRELLDGLVILMGGFLICVPGFISDALGLLLMIGPLRHLVIRTTGHHLARRVPTVRIRSWGTPGMDPRTVRDVSSTPWEPPDRFLGPGNEG